MSGRVGVLSGVLTALDAASVGDLARVESAALLAELAAVGEAANRLAGLRHRLLAEVESRRHDGDYGGTRTSAELLTAVTPTTLRAARAAVELALALMPQRTLTGQPVGQLAPLTASASLAGQVSPEQAQVILDCLDAAPDWLSDEDVAVVEKVMLEAAATEHPAALRVTARALLARLDQDGPEPCDADTAPGPVRRLHLVRRNGRTQLRVDLDAAEEALVRTVLDPLAAPRPADDTTPDPRSAGERDHDACVEVFTRILRSDTLGHAGGAPVTILATTTLAELRAGQGHATTEHGAVLPLTALVELAGDAEILPVVLDRLGAVLCLGRSIRLATLLQRRALAARDRGCCFPGCTRPVSWTQVHHIRDWQHGGTTDLDNLCLLCKYHHRTFTALGWQVIVRDGLPHWIPPAWLDPHRQPIRNTAHHLPEIRFPVREPRTTPAGAAPP